MDDHGGGLLAAKLTVTLMRLSSVCLRILRPSFIPILRDGSARFLKRVSDGAAFNLLPMLQVFAVEGVTARFEHGGDDGAVLEAESVGGAGRGHVDKALGWG